MSNKIKKTVELLKAAANVLVTFAGFIGAVSIFFETMWPNNNNEESEA